MFFSCVHSFNNYHNNSKSFNFVNIFVFDLEINLCDSERIRTFDPKLRRFVLYPAELPNRFPTLRLQVSSYFGFCYLKNLRGIPHKKVNRYWEQGRFSSFIPTKPAFKDVRFNTLPRLNETLASLLSITYSS